MIWKTPGHKNQIQISACVYLGQALVGYTISWTGPIIPKLRDPLKSPLPYPLSETEIALIASLIYVGCIPGPYIMGWLSNFKGRKPCLIIGGSISIIAYTLLTTSTNLAMLFCGRFLCGFGTGIIGLMNVVYIGEIASTSIRGILLTVVGVFTTIGSIVMFSIGPFYSYHVSTYVGLFLALTFTLCSFMLPESPIFYILKDDEEALVNVLQILGREYDKNNLSEVKKEFQSTNAKMDWIELFTLKTNRQGLLVVVTMNVLQHSSGVAAVVFYSASIFDLAGSSINWSICMIIIGSFQLVGSLVAPFFIEKQGRRTLLLISTALCSLSMLILGVYFYLIHKGDTSIYRVNWLPLLTLILFFIGYDSGLGIIPNVLTGEMFTSNVRSKGSAVALTLAWLAGFLVTTAFGSMVVNFGGHGSFWFFSCTCACAFLFSLFCVPETKGKTLLEIQKFMNHGY